LLANKRLQLDGEVLSPVLNEKWAMDFMRYPPGHGQ